MSFLSHKDIGAKGRETTPGLGTKMGYREQRPVTKGLVGYVKELGLFSVGNREPLKDFQQGRDRFKFPCRRHSTHRNQWVREEVRTKVTNVGGSSL